MPVTDMAAPQSRNPALSSGRWINLKTIVFKYNFARYTLCANVFEIIKHSSSLKCMLFLLFFVNNHYKTAMEDPHPHTSVTINWTSLRQLHLIWRSCLCKACFQVRELLGFCSSATKKKTKKMGSHDILTTPTTLILANLTTCDNTVTSAKVRGWEMQPLPPVDMQLRHHHERSTAWTDLAFANTGHPFCAAVVIWAPYKNN